KPEAEFEPAEADCVELISEDDAAAERHDEPDCEKHDEISQIDAPVAASLFVKAHVMQSIGGDVDREVQSARGRSMESPT
ncbi:MAG TPA: hypothetical protein VFX76_02635, partial [Roseiflexaceae bacterium]|nr:hypothetical protein [Roseiflexaceae bacterium]